MLRVKGTPTKASNQRPMRSSKSRSRSKSNRNRSMGNIVNRVFDSSGPEGKVRGTPQQIIDKYNQLARDAQLGNDRVAMENFQQHAEHYLRMLAAAQKEQEARREQQERERQQTQQNNQQRRDDNRGGENRQQQDAAKQHPGEGEQPDLRATESGPELVETPEAASEPPQPKPRRPRKPKQAEVEAAVDDAGSDAPPEAAE